MTFTKVDIATQFHAKAKQNTSMMTPRPLEEKNLEKEREREWRENGDKKRKENHTYHTVGNFGGN